MRELWRQRPRRGVLQKFAGDASARYLDPNVDEKQCFSWSDGLDADEETSCGFQAGALVADLCESVGWAPVFQYSVRRFEHIVTKEARPICTLVRRLAA